MILIVGIPAAIFCSYKAAQQGYGLAVAAIWIGFGWMSFRKMTGL